MPSSLQMRQKEYLSRGSVSCPIHMQRSERGRRLLQLLDLRGYSLANGRRRSRKMDIGPLDERRWVSLSTVAGPMVP
jgi:hypothetical protein